jgi:hypothetical protein
MEYDAERKVFLLEGDDGTEITVPACMEVCGRCQGHGTHTNPAIDGHGITMAEWNGPDWDDDARAGYLSGQYDVTCETCGGANVVPVPDLDRVSGDVRRQVAATLESEARYRAEARHEAQMGY